MKYKIKGNVFAWPFHLFLKKLWQQKFLISEILSFIFKQNTMFDRKSP